MVYHFKEKTMVSTPNSKLFNSMAETIKENVIDESVRKCIYVEMISHFEDFGCDTLDESVDIDPLLDEILKDCGLISDDEDEYWEENK